MWPSSNLGFYPPQGTKWGRVLFTLEPRADGSLPMHAAVGHCHPASQTQPPRPTVSWAKQGLCTRYPSAGGQAGLTEPLAARLRTLPGLAGKSPLCCQATAGGPSGSCLPRPGPQVRSKPPRPWPGARASSPAQMPPGSWRVGTCLREGGDWDPGCTTTSPLPAWLSALLR